VTEAVRRLPPPAKNPPVVAGRLPPHDLDAEAACIAAVLTTRDNAEARARFEAAPGLCSEHFYSEANGKIWGAIADLYRANREIDSVTCATHLRDTGRLEAVGGPRYIGQIQDETPAAANIGSYAQIVRSKWQMRRMIAECQRLAAEGYGECGPTFIGDAARAIGEVAELDAEGAFAWLDVSALDSLAVPVAWVCRGLGICPGRPAILVGTGYSGKSLLALEIAFGVCLGRAVLRQFDAQRGRVVWLDFELGRSQMARRIKRLAHAKGVPHEELRGVLDVACRPRLDLTNPDAERFLRRAMAGAKLLVVDSLRRAVVGLDENDSRITAPLDMLARLSDETGCAVLVLHHASTKTDPRAPKPTDLRGMGRGSSAIFDCSGSYLVMDGAPGEPVKVTHVREPQEGRLTDPFLLKFHDVSDGADPKAGLALEYLTEAQAELEVERREKALVSKYEPQILAFVAANPGASGNAVCDAVGGKRTNVRVALDQLVARGALTSTSGVRNTSSYRVAGQS
jgi:hypothetical protein